MNKPKVLFLCTGNSARSQMAEAFLRQYGGMHFEVFSAGLEPSVINPLTIQVMEEIGVDMSGYFAKGLKQFVGRVRRTHREQQSPSKAHPSAWITPQARPERGSLAYENYT